MLENTDVLLNSFMIPSKNVPKSKCAMFSHSKVSSQVITPFLFLFIAMSKDRRIQCLLPKSTVIPSKPVGRASKSLANKLLFEIFFFLTKLLLNLQPTNEKGDAFCPLCTVAVNTSGISLYLLKRLSIYIIYFQKQSKLTLCSLYLYQTIGRNSHTIFLKLLQLNRS